MNTNDLGILMLAILAGSVSLALFIVAGSLFLKILKALLLDRRPQLRTHGGMRLIERRRAQMNPNIICMLPIHEEKRPEAPLW